MLVYILGITKRGNKEITNRGKVQGLQIGERVITNRGSFRDFKSRRKITNPGKEISNRGNRDYKPGQGLQIGAEHMDLQTVT